MSVLHWLKIRSQAPGELVKKIMIGCAAGYPISIAIFSYFDLTALKISVAGLILFVSTNAPSQLLMNLTLVRPLGEENGISPERRANLMSAAVCSIFYMMPWCLAVMVWYTSIEAAAISSGLAIPSAAISFMAPYPWALLGVMMFSIFTGWKRSPKANPAVLINAIESTLAAHSAASTK
ncbi:hypothetical protein [Kistimonas scapharcae]